MSAILQALYEPIYNYFEGNYLYINSVAGTFLFIAFFFSINLPFIILDFSNSKWIRSFKIQDDKEVSLERYLSALRRILPNVFLVSPVISFLAYFLMRDKAFSLNTLPSITTILVQLGCFIIVEEILFYYSHRLLHHPSIYKHVHKIHHEFTAPVSIVSVYAHPFEHVVSNVLPILAGPVLIGSHIMVQWLWIALALTSTTISHSGYYFPIPPTSAFHDYHHKVFNECFGVLGILDRMHGTSQNYLATIEKNGGNGKGCSEKKFKS